MMEAHIPSVLPTTSPFSVGATADVRLAPNHDNPQGGWAKCRIIGLAGGGLFDVYMIQEGKSIYGVAEENLQLSFDNWTAPPMQMQAPGGGGGGAAPVPAPVPGEAAPAPAPAPGPGFEAPTPEPQHKAAAGGDGGKKAKAKAKAKKKKQQPQVFVDPAVAAATAAGLLAEAKVNGTEPPVYKCEYFAEFKCCFESEDFAAVQAHEKQCVRNPFHSNWKVLPIKKRLKKKVVKSPRMKFCQGLIEMLHQKKNKEFNWPFLKAVEWRTLKWYTYPTKIKKPMDLGTVKSNLKQGQYTTAEEFIADVRLIFTNCYTWNGRDQGISRLAMSLSHIFEFELAKMPDPPPGGDIPTSQDDDEEDQTATIVSDVSNISFKVKGNLSVLSEGRWYPAVVLAVHPADRRVDIHFTGFKSGTDRDYSVDDPKIRAPPTTEDLEVIQRNIAEGYATRAKLITASVDDEVVVDEEDEEDELEVASGAFAEEEDDEVEEEEDDEQGDGGMKGGKRKGTTSIAAAAAKRARIGGSRGRGGSRGGRGGRGRGGRGRGGIALDGFQFFEASSQGSGG
eukprot:gene21019-28274_t